MITLTSNILNKLNNVKYTRKTQTVRDLQGRKATLREFILPKIQMAGLVINNIKGIETHPFPWGSGSDEPPESAKNGVIGLGFVAKFNIIIDYKNAKLILIKGDGFPPGYDIFSWKKIPFTMSRGNVITSANRLNSSKKKLSLLWDTGVPFNFIKPASTTFGEIKSCTKIIVDKPGDNLKECNEIITTFIMGNYHFKNMNFHIDSMKGLPADGIIGEPFFKTHAVYINFSQRMLAINATKN